MQITKIGQLDWHQFFGVFFSDLGLGTSVTIFPQKEAEKDGLGMFGFYTCKDRMCFIKFSPETDTQAST